MTTAIVVGCGPSLERLALPEPKPADHIVIACNRAIERVRADFWIWVDAMHYERSHWHPHARQATRVSVGASRPLPHESLLHFAPSDALPCGDGELFLAGGTLTVAAHLAVRLGARRVVFTACDAWDDARDRYHAWDGAPLDDAGRALHRDHLSRTAESVRRLAAAHRDVSFLDATDAPRHLGLPFAELPRGESMPFRPDLSLPRGFGRLTGISTYRESAVLWFEDTGGALRAVRLDCDATDGLALAMRGVAVVGRTP